MSKPIALLLPFEEPKEGNDTAGNSLKGETTFVVDRFTLHEAAKNGKKEEVLEILQASGDERAAYTNDCDRVGWTALHYAAYYNHLSVIEVLLLSGADPNFKTKNDRIVGKSFFWKGSTALHIAAGKGHEMTATLLLEPNKHLQQCGPENSCHLQQANVDSENCIMQTPLHVASRYGYQETIAVLLRHGANVNKKDDDGKTVAHYACFWGKLEVLKMLLDQETANLEEVDNDGNTPLMLAILEGYEDVVKTIVVNVDHATSRRLFMIYNKENTTPIRKAIKRMPDTAALMLDCYIEPKAEFSNTSKNYRLAVDYDILQDPEQDFDHKNHLFKFIVQSENINLLKHPLVTYFLRRKWEWTRFLYLLCLAFYCIFLAFLTTFALTVPSPISESCSTVFNGTPGNASLIDDCDLSGSRRRVIFTAAIFVIIFALVQLIIETIEMYLHKLLYFTDLVNWMELSMTVSSIIFAWVFNTDCLCPYGWQWQIGTIAVFLAWIDFVIFVQKLPGVGIYVGMLREILWRFIKTIPLTILLVIAFSLGFFMLFSEPGILRSPFSTPAQAILTVIAYSAGEFDYNGHFRLPSGGTTADNNPEEIPFPPVSYILFIAFLIIMSILLSNLLTALAVGDTEKILQNAEAKNITLKIQLILSAEALIQAILCFRYIVISNPVYPNRLSLLERLQKKLKLGASLPKGIEISEVLKREDYSLKSLTERTLTLMRDVQEIKRCHEAMKQTMETALKRDDDIKKCQDELKQSQEEFKQMMHELLQKLA